MDFRIIVMKIALDLINKNYKSLLKNMPVAPPSFGRNDYSSAVLSLKEPLKADKVEISRSKAKNKPDLLTLSKEEIINAILISSKKSENFIGNGNEAKVYKIDGTNYCVRVPYESKSLKNSDISLAVSEKDKVNHVVARFSNGVTIMKLIDGFSLEGRFSDTFPQAPRNKALLKLPVSAFNKLFKQVCNAKDNDMIFDCSAPNLIINPKEKTITAIDFYEMDPEYPEVVKPLRHMLEAMGDSDDFEFRKRVIGKILLGALEELKPDVKPCLNIGEFKFRDFMDNAQNGGSLCRSQKWAKLKDVLTEVECLKIKEMAGGKVKDMLQYKIDEASELIQVLSSCENSCFV